jgi:hypothetical protein
MYFMTVSCSTARLSKWLPSGEEGAAYTLSLKERQSFGGVNGMGAYRYGALKYGLLSRYR